jgi:predicted glycosyltransferase
LKTATYVLSPSSTNLGKYNSKKISFSGYKELGYLHPDYFIPDPQVVKTFNPENTRYFIIRVVLLKSTHDVGKSGITDEKVRKLIKLLEGHGKVYISSERELPVDLEKHRLIISPEKISQAIYFADLFISDSQTMTSEAAILGTPAFRFNDFVGKISVMEEKEFKYGLAFGFLTDDFISLFETVGRFLEIKDLKEKFHIKRDIMLKDCIDLTKFMVWLFEDFPYSLQEIKKNPEYQKKFL